MALPPGVQLYITSADGTKRRKLPRAQVETITTQKERFGGFGQCTISTAIPYRQAGSLTIQIGDRVETYYQGARRYRGYITAITPTEDEPRKIVLTAFGVSLLLRKQFVDKAYAYPSGGVDVSAAFAQLAQDYLQKATGPSGFRLIQSVQSLFVGTPIQLLDARQKLAGDAIDALIQSAGNLAVWGCDVDSAGNNRLFFRPLAAASPPTHAIPVPGRIVETATGEEQTADLVNQLFVTGGAPIYPQLLHNGNFSLPVYQQQGAGNLITNGGFEVGTSNTNANAWALNNGAQAFTNFSIPPKQAQPYTGSRCLGLESISQNAVQTGNAAFVAGHNYVLSIRAAKEMDQQIATGHATLLVKSSSGTTLLTQTVSLTPTGQGYDYFSGTFAAPAGATSYSITLACDSNNSSGVPFNNGYSGGLLIDDVELYDVATVYQDGWSTVPADPTAAYVNAVNWIYQDSAFEGGYSVYLDATGADSDGHDLKLEPLETNRFKVSPSQTLRYGVWVKSPPTSPNPNPPKFFLELRFYDSSGNITRTPPRATFTPGFLSNWTYYELVAYALAGEVAADANITWRSSGSLLVDSQSVRDDQAAPMASGNGSTTSLLPYLPEGNLVYFIKASDSYLNGTWRPANGLSNPAPYASSETTYGPRCGMFSDTSVLQLDDAMAVADSTFTSQAFPLYRPSVTVVNDPRIYNPGETVNLIGADGPTMSPTALPIARVVDTYDGLLKTRLEMEKEQPDVSLVVKRIVQDELRRLGPGGSTSYASGGYSSSSGGASGAGSGPTYRGNLAASATDSTLHDAYTGAPHASAASQAGWTGTSSEVVAARTRTVKGVSSTTLEGRLDAMEADIANATGFTAAAVQAPVSVSFDHADYVGGTEYITWRAKNTAAYSAGAIEFYGWQTSPDNATWTTEAFGGDTYQGVGLTSGNQYARARAYPLVTSGATPTPSGWVTSAAQTYAVSSTGSTGTTISVVTTLPTPSTSTDNNFFVVRQSGAKDLLYLGAHNAAGGSRFASITLAFYLNKLPLSSLISDLAMNWLCNSGSGNTLVDAQGVANLTTSATGIWGTDATAPSAYNPSGSQYASVATATALSGTGSFSFESAFYDAEDGLQRFLFTMPSSGSAEALRIFRYTDNKWYVDMQTSGATLFRATSSSPVAAGLTHLLVTYNAGTNLLSLYLNGSLAGSVTYSGTRQAFTGFQRAADQVSNPGTKYWTGNIYFARVYTADESANAAAMFANL